MSFIWSSSSITENIKWPCAEYSLFSPPKSIHHLLHPILASKAGLYEIHQRAPSALLLIADFSHLEVQIGNVRAKGVEVGIYLSSSLSARCL